jgi:hypothetical protein
MAEFSTFFGVYFPEPYIEIQRAKFTSPGLLQGRGPVSWLRYKNAPFYSGYLSTDIYRDNGEKYPLT